MEHKLINFLNILGFSDFSGDLIDFTYFYVLRNEDIECLVKFYSQEHGRFHIEIDVECVKTGFTRNLKTSTSNFGEIHYDMAIDFIEKCDLMIPVILKTIRKEKIKRLIASKDDK